MLVEEPLSDHFRGFAAVAERDGGTTYAAISRGVAEDDEVLALLDRAALPQRRPLILLAAVHYLLLSGAEDPLAGYYDTVRVVRGQIASTDRTVTAPPPGDPTGAFRDFCRAHRSELEELIATRSTQTNEVGRCTALLPGLCHIASLSGWDVPLSLLDLGTSAGLNLLFDDYAYTYRSATGEATRTAGSPGSDVQLACEARDDVASLPELRLPVMAERVGLDLSPVDPFSDEDARWLLACQWPDNPARFGRLRSALDNVRAAPDPPRLVQGDMVRDLGSVADSIPGDNPLVVFHSWVAAYLDEPQQQALADEVRALGRRRCRCTTSTARPPSRRRACRPRPRPCAGRVPTSPPQSSTSARAPSRCGSPTPIPTATGSAGGRRPAPVPAALRPRAPTARRAGRVPARRRR